MGLAGNMKLSTFVVGVGAVVVIGGAAASVFWPESPVEEEREAKEAEVAELEGPLITPPVVDRAPTKGPPPDEPTLDDRWIAFVGVDLGTDKKKDVHPGESWKLNVYQDAGEATANRAKIDLDRDDAWDMKLTFGETITRQVSTNDDEVYDIEETWNGGDWAIGTEPAEVEAPTAPELAWMGKDLGVSKIKDASWSGTGKINVYQDDGEATANRAKIDLDRDDAWDIKITYGDPPTRKVSSADDETYDVEQTWTGSGWE